MVSIVTLPTPTCKGDSTSVWCTCSVVVSTGGQSQYIARPLPLLHLYILASLGGEEVVWLHETTLGFTCLRVDRAAAVMLCGSELGSTLRCRDAWWLPVHRDHTWASCMYTTPGSWDIWGRGRRREGQQSAT